MMEVDQLSEERLLANDQAAELLNISPKTLNNSRYTGRLLGHPAPPFYKLGKSVRYKRSDIREWLSQFQPQINTAQSHG